MCQCTRTMTYLLIRVTNVSSLPVSMFAGACPCKAHSVYMWAKVLMNAHVWVEMEGETHRCLNEDSTISSFTSSRSSEHWHRNGVLVTGCTRHPPVTWQPHTPEGARICCSPGHLLDFFFFFVCRHGTDKNAPRSGHFGWNKENSEREKMYGILIGNGMILH